MMGFLPFFRSGSWAGGVGKLMGVGSLERGFAKVDVVGLIERREGEIV